MGADQEPCGRIVRVGVQVIIREGDRVLLGLRAKTFGEGSWGLPGGHIEPDESIFDAAAREALEETGIVVDKMRLACVTDPDRAANHHMQIGVEVLSHTGEITVREPQRCVRWEYWPVHALPSPLFIASGPVLRNAESGDLYRQPVRTPVDPLTPDQLLR